MAVGSRAGRAASVSWWSERLVGRGQGDERGAEVLSRS